jgi:hypothetical protein
MKVAKHLVKRYYPLILSIIIPGLGQFVKGQCKKGLLIFVSLIILYFLTKPFIIFLAEIFHNPFLILFYLAESWIAMAIIYLWQIIDVCVNTIDIRSDKKNIRLMHSKREKNNTLPSMLSLALPGSGQLIKGDKMKGLLIMIGAPIPFMTVFLFVFNSDYYFDTILYILSFFFAVVICFYIWQFFDAYNN